MLIFLYGADSFRSREYLKKSIEQFKKQRDPQGLNVIKLEVDKIDGGEVLREIKSTPFLAEKRLIVIENLLSKGKDDLLKEVLKMIKEEKMPKDNVLIIWEDVLTFKSKIAKELFALLAKEKFTQEFAELTPLQLSSWIKKEIEEKKGKINQLAVKYLADNIKGNIYRLSHLLEQLANYKQGDEIGVSDVAEFLDAKADDNIFNLVEAIVGREKKQVFKMIREQYKKGEDPQFIFAMLLRQFRILVQIRDLFEREDNLTSDLIAKKIGIHPFVVKKSMPLAKRYTLEDLKKIYQLLLDFDVKTKTGQIDQSVLLDILVGRLIE